jgi:hypothetical protein
MKEPERKAFTTMRICDACRRREERGAHGLRAYIVKIQGPVDSGQHGELGTYELCEGCHERLVEAVRDAVERVVNPPQEARPEGHSGKDSLP